MSRRTLAASRTTSRPRTRSSPLVGRTRVATVADEGGLARAVRPEYGQDLAGRSGELQPVQCRHLAEPHGQAASLEQGRGWRLRLNCHRCSELIETATFGSGRRSSGTGPRGEPSSASARYSRLHIADRIATPPRCTRTSALRISPLSTIRRPSARAAPVQSLIRHRPIRRASRPRGRRRRGPAASPARGRCRGYLDVAGCDLRGAQVKDDAPREARTSNCRRASSAPASSRRGCAPGSGRPDLPGPSWSRCSSRSPLSLRRQAPCLTSYVASDSSLDTSSNTTQF